MACIRDSFATSESHHLLKTQTVKNESSVLFWLTRQPDVMFVLLPDLYSLKEFTAAT